MAEETTDFGTMMRQARDRLGLTQAELAEKVGVTQVTISNWEKGKSTPEGEQRARVEEVLQSRPFRNGRRAGRSRATMPSRSWRRSWDRSATSQAERTTAPKLREASPPSAHG